MVKKAKQALNRFGALRRRAPAHQIRSTESTKCRRARPDLRLGKAVRCRRGGVKKTRGPHSKPNPTSAKLRPKGRSSGAELGGVAGRTWQQAIQATHEAEGAASGSGMGCSAQAEVGVACAAGPGKLRQACSNEPTWPTAIQLKKPMASRRMILGCCCRRMSVHRYSTTP